MEVYSSRSESGTEMPTKSIIAGMVAAQTVIDKTLAPKIKEKAEETGMTEAEVRKVIVRELDHIKKQYND